MVLGPWGHARGRVLRGAGGAWSLHARQELAKITPVRPKLGLAALIIDVDRDTAFMDELLHAGGQQARSPARRGQLFAALVAAATGIGYTSPSSVAAPSPGSPPGKPANSIGVRMIKAIRTAVEAIPEDAWQRIDYPADGEAHIAQTTYEH